MKETNERKRKEERKRARRRRMREKQDQGRGRRKHAPDLQWVYLPRNMNEDKSAVMRGKIKVSADGLWNPFVFGSLEKQDSVVYLIG